MKNRLNSKKVVEEINSIIATLNDRISKEEDFEDIHKKALMICQLVFSQKKKYKLIDRPYPVFVIITFDESFDGDKSKNIELPTKEHRIETKKRLAGDITTVLNEARELHELKLKLEEK